MGTKRQERGSRQILDLLGPATNTDRRVRTYGRSLEMLESERAALQVQEYESRDEFAQSRDPAPTMVGIRDANTITNMAAALNYGTVPSSPVGPVTPAAYQSQLHRVTPRSLHPKGLKRHTVSVQTLVYQDHYVCGYSHSNCSSGTEDMSWLVCGVRQGNGTLVARITRPIGAEPHDRSSIIIIKSSDQPRHLLQIG